MNLRKGIVNSRTKTTESKEQYYEVLLPKNWVLNDYSPTENLVDIEDESDGVRFWTEMRRLLKIEIGHQLSFYTPGKKEESVEVYKLDATIRRKRCYVQIFFQPINLTEFIVGL